MKNISGALLGGLASGSPVYFKRIRLQARAWNGSAYVWEAARDVTADLLELAPVRWKLDREAYGVWTLANTTLKLRNERGQWREGAAGGYFTDGRVMYKSRVTIEAGVSVEDGETAEYLFTGLIKNDPAYDIDAREVTVTIVGQLSLFEDCSAEDISIPVSGELAGSESDTEFYTSASGVGKIISVKRGATEAGEASAVELQTQTDYSVADLNEPSKPAKITLNDQLTTGNSLWLSYIRWHQDKSIEWAAERICEQAGVGNKAISPAVFTTSARNTFAQTDSAGFSSGSGESVIWEGGDVKSKADFAPYVSLEWETAEGTNISWDRRPMLPEFYTGAERVCAAPCLPSTSPDKSARWASARAASSASVGTWQFDCDEGALSATPHYLHFISSGGDRTACDGYCLKIVFSNRAANTLSFSLHRVNAGAMTRLWSTDYCATRQPWGNSFSFLRFRISRDSSGAFALFVMHGVSGQWTEFGTIARDNSITASSNILAAFEFPAWDLSCPQGAFLRIGYSWQVMTGSGGYYPYVDYVSPAIDGGPALTKWGELSTLEDIPEGTATAYDAREKDAEGGTWGEWTSVGNTGRLPLSKRFIQLRWRASSNAAQDAAPSLQQWSVEYYTSAITLPLLNFTGLTCMQALEELAGMCAYEIGFDTSDTFIFRPRVTALTPVMTLNSGNMLEVTKLSTGAERLYNRVTVAFGEYTRTADPRTLGEARPDSIDLFGVKELSVASGGLLPAESVDIAWAIAPTVYAYTGKARRQATVKTRFAVHLELGDRVTAVFSDIFRLWAWGEAGSAYGDANRRYYSEAPDGAVMLMRVEGIEYDLENWTTTFDLVEAG